MQGDPLESKKLFTVRKVVGCTCKPGSLKEPRRAAHSARVVHTCIR